MEVFSRVGGAVLLNEGRSGMTTSATRQRARRAALEAVAANRKLRAELEQRRDELAATVLASLAERDAITRETETTAGASLHELMETGLSWTDTVAWCPGLTQKEARRLVQAITDTTPGPGPLTP